MRSIGFEEKSIIKIVECINNLKICFFFILFDIIKCIDNDEFDIKNCYDSIYILKVIF